MTFRKSLDHLAERFVDRSGGDDGGSLAWWEDHCEVWAKDPWKFFTAKGPDKRPLIWTRDPLDKERPKKPFPDHLKYLQYTTSVMHEEPFIFIEKSRQMFVSTLSCLYIYWDCVFGRYREWLISKSKIDESKKLLKDKIRATHSFMPAIFRQMYPMSETPATVARFGHAGCEIVAVPANVATSEARGRTASGVLIDEAPLQAELEQIIAACLPMTDKLFVVGTPALGDGAACMVSYMRDNQVADDRPQAGIPGMQYHKTYRNVSVLRIEYFADPRKDAAWIAKERLKYASNVLFQREYELNWSSAEGKPYYPEVAEDPGPYIRKFPGPLLSTHVSCGWDFGFRAPAVTFHQYSTQQDRVWVLRELCPRDIDIHSFARLVKFARGQADFESIKNYPKAVYWAKVIEADPQMPDLPWFEPGTVFRDFAGPEAHKRGSLVAAGAAEYTDAEVLRSLGIPLLTRTSFISAREDVIRRLLLMRDDGVPGLLFDPACRTLIKGFCGGIHYPKSTPGTPNPTQPRKDGECENPHDAFGYAVLEDVPATLDGSDGGFTFGWSETA